MASLANDPAGTRRILFVDPDGRRRTIRLGKLPKRDAQAVRTRVEALLAAKIAGQPIDRDTARWLGSVGQTLHDKLAAANLIDGRQSATIGDWTRRWLDRRAKEVKPGSLVPMRQTRRLLIQHFGHDRPLAQVTVSDVEDFAHWMRHERTPRLGEATARKRCSIAARIFDHARKRKLIEANPFADADITTGGATNSERQHYVSVDDAQRTLEQLTTVQWRLLFALARFAGVRVPSEPRLLTWADVDWSANSLRIRSPKTSHHHGGAERFTPITPALLPYLRDAYEAADEGQTLVLPMLQGLRGASLRKPLLTAIRRAGLQAWPRLWNNCRASCETDWHAHHPLASVCRWIGNSPTTAARHYLTARDEDFEAATRASYGVAQNAAHHSPAGGCIGDQEPTQNRTQTHGDALGCGQVIAGGLEPPTC